MPCALVGATEGGRDLGFQEPWSGRPGEPVSKLHQCRLIRVHTLAADVEIQRLAGAAREAIGVAEDVWMFVSHDSYSLPI